MGSQRLEPIRIVIIARPALGRAVSDILAGAGYEVYRTPSASDLHALQRRLRPHLAVVALDLLEQDGLKTASQLRSYARGIPVLLLGDASGTQRASDLPILSSTAEPAVLLATIARFLGARNCAA